MITRVSARYTAGIRPEGLGDLRSPVVRRFSGASFLRPRRRFSRRVGSSWTRSLEARPRRQKPRLSFRRCALDVRGTRQELGHGHVHHAELPDPPATSPCATRERRIGMSTSKVGIRGSRFAEHPVLGVLSWEPVSAGLPRPQPPPRSLADHSLSDLVGDLQRRLQGPGAGGDRDLLAVGRG
jgi:hypothetical protein